jgi:hypothetical protein
LAQNVPCHGIGHSQSGPQLVSGDRTPVLLAVRGIELPRTSYQLGNRSRPVVRDDWGRSWDRPVQRSQQVRADLAPADQ